MSNGVKAWSYSAYALYDQCPAKYKYEKIEKRQQPDNKAFIKGRKWHKDAELYLTKQIDERPKTLDLFAEQFDELREMEPFVEQQWGFTEAFKPTGWFGKDTWFRGIVDQGVLYSDNTADIIDNKTGKMYDTNEDQIELFSFTVMKKYPNVKHVTARLWYLESGDEIVREFSADIKDELEKKWRKKVKPLFNDTIFAPKPNRFCDWCHFRKSNGGPCKHG